MDDKEEQLKSFDREDFIISNQVVNSPEGTERCIKLMEQVMAQRKAKQLITSSKSKGLLEVKKRNSTGIRRTK